MKALSLSVFLLFPLITVTSQNHKMQQDFIETYAAIAVVEMQRTGIPASIKLAQAILESSWGQGTVAVEGNNFFGIKCNNGWEGRCVKWMDDELLPSDFRSYDHIEESFRDHSDFLTNNIRYRLLFDIPVTDYRNWAYGLKQYGYATDSIYAVKLIRLIEEHGLYLYDDAKPGQQFQILDTPPDAQIVKVQPDWELQSFRPDKFTILSSVQFGPERLEIVMEAPAYDLGDYFRFHPANLAAPDHEADFTSVPERKIWPVYPVPVVTGYSD